MAATLTRLRRALTESCTLPSGGCVDREARVIRGVKIIGLLSRNKPLIDPKRPERGRLKGRRYTLECLRRAAPLYESAPVYFGHPKRAGDNRDHEDPVGLLRDIEVRQDGLYGDLHWQETHSRAAALVEAAERNPSLYCLSHNAHGDGHIAADGWDEITEMQDVHSVDVVRRGATTRSLFEAETDTDAFVRALLEGDACKGDALRRLLAAVASGEVSAEDAMARIEGEEPLEEEYFGDGDEGDHGKAHGSPKDGTYKRSQSAIGPGVRKEGFGVDAPAPGADGSKPERPDDRRTQRSIERAGAGQEPLKEADPRFGRLRPGGGSGSYVGERPSSDQEQAQARYDRHVQANGRSASVSVKDFMPGGSRYPKAGGVTESLDTDGFVKALLEGSQDQGGHGMRLGEYFDALALNRVERRVVNGLLEGEMIPADASVDMTPPDEEAGEADHVAALRGGFKASCDALIEDALNGGDTAVALKKLKALIMSHAKLSAPDEAKGGEQQEDDDAENGGKDDDEPLEESDERPYASNLGAGTTPSAGVGPLKRMERHEMDPVGGNTGDIKDTARDNEHPGKGIGNEAPGRRQQKNIETRGASGQGVKEAAGDEEGGFLPKNGKMTQSEHGFGVARDQKAAPAYMGREPKQGPGRRERKGIEGQGRSGSVRESADADRMAWLEAREECRELCEAEGFVPGKALLDALCRTPPDGRRALIEEARGAGERTARAPRNQRPGGAAPRQPGVRSTEDFVAALTGSN